MRHLNLSTEGLIAPAKGTLFLGRVLLFSILSLSSAQGSNEPLVYLNQQQLRQLSQNTLQINVDQGERFIRLQGAWPKLCGDTATVDSQHTNIGFKIEIAVTKNCLQLLASKRKKLLAQPKVSLSELVVLGRLRTNEQIYIFGPKQKLTLDLPANTDLTEPRKKNGLLASAPDKGMNLPEPDTYSRPDSKLGVSSSLNYRDCNSAHYGMSGDPMFCNGRYGIEMGTKVPVGKGLSLEGTTQFMVKPTQSGEVSPLNPRTPPEVHFNIKYEFPSGENQ